MPESQNASLMRKGGGPAVKPSLPRARWGGNKYARRSWSPGNRRSNRIGERRQTERRLERKGSDLTVGREGFELWINTSASCSSSLSAQALLSYKQPAAAERAFTVPRRILVNMKRLNYLYLSLLNVLHVYIKNGLFH
ncbi:Polynucleotide 5'-hydroxyl-kinase grc3 [Clarias magur]|uniref:Polynucleotide 5'-hydroxyl-kinase grc3 n=1 Tax=Clarias magur TaxID=1594786 RepID=A0A8J4XAZ0_CLAMG|nr:Polynucleotide 5'-hydroxyl-kinase grc3 [Clarias magur]